MSQLETNKANESGNSQMKNKSLINLSVYKEWSFSLFLCDGFRILFFCITVGFLLNIFVILVEVIATHNEIFLKLSFVIS